MGEEKTARTPSGWGERNMPKWQRQGDRANAVRALPEHRPKCEVAGVDLVMRW